MEAPWSCYLQLSARTVRFSRFQRRRSFSLAKPSFARAVDVAELPHYIQTNFIASKTLCKVIEGQALCGSYSSDRSLVAARHTLHYRNENIIKNHFIKMVLKSTSGQIERDGSQTKSKVWEIQATVRMPACLKFLCAFFEQNARTRSVLSNRKRAVMGANRRALGRHWLLDWRAAIASIVYWESIYTRPIVRNVGQ